MEQEWKETTSECRIPGGPHVRCAWVFKRCDRAWEVARLLRWYPYLEVIKGWGDPDLLFHFKMPCLEDWRFKMQHGN
jgi:hypothetical protein